MPIQPCPACGRPTPRLLEEVSRHAIVKYYRCDSCGHVWTVHNTTGAVHHVTPLGREETEVDGWERPTVDWSELTASWRGTRLRSGLAIVASAAASGSDSDSRERSRQAAERVLQTVRAFLPRATLSRDEAMDLLADFHRLDEAIQQLKAAGK